MFGGKTGLMFYDVTPLYFDTSQTDVLCEPGSLKTVRCAESQIVLGPPVSEGDTLCRIPCSTVASTRGPQWYWWLTTSNNASRPSSRLTQMYNDFNFRCHLHIGKSWRTFRLVGQFWLTLSLLAVYPAVWRGTGNSTPKAFFVTEPVLAYISRHFLCIRIFRLSYLLSCHEDTS